MSLAVSLKLKLSLDGAAAGAVKDAGAEKYTHAQTHEAEYTNTLMPAKITAKARKLWG